MKEETRICKKCMGKCCKKEIPGLLPEEVSNYPSELLRILKCGEYSFYTFKKIGGKCINLNKNDQCKIYEKRPIECKIWPIILDVTAPKELKFTYASTCPIKDYNPKKEMKYLKKIYSSLPDFWKKWQGEIP